MKRETYWLRVSRGGSDGDRCRWSCRFNFESEKSNQHELVENTMLKCHLSAHFMTVATNKMCIRFGACGLVLWMCVRALEWEPWNIGNHVTYKIWIPCFTLLYSRFYSAWLSYIFSSVSPFILHFILLLEIVGVYVSQRIFQITIDQMLKSWLVFFWTPACSGIIMQMMKTHHRANGFGNTQTNPKKTRKTSAAQCS